MGHSSSTCNTQARTHAWGVALLTSKPSPFPDQPPGPPHQPTHTSQCNDLGRSSHHEPHSARLCRWHPMPPTVACSFLLCFLPLNSFSHSGSGRGLLVVTTVRLGRSASQGGGGGTCGWGSIGGECSSLQGAGRPTRKGSLPSYLQRLETGPNPLTRSPSTEVKHDSKLPSTPVCSAVGRGGVGHVDEEHSPDELFVLRAHSEHNAHGPHEQAGEAAHAPM